MSVVCKARPCGQIVPTICFYKVLLECSLVRQNNGPLKSLCPSSWTCEYISLPGNILLHMNILLCMPLQMWLRLWMLRWGVYTEWQPVREIGQKEGESVESAEGLSSLWVAVEREEEVINPEMQVTLEAGNSVQLTARKWGTAVLQPQETKFCQNPN